MSKKIALGNLRFVSMLFLIFEKAMSKKIALGILRFVSVLFNVIIFWYEWGLEGYLGFVCMHFISIVIFKKLLL